MSLSELRSLSILIEGVEASLKEPSLVLSQNLSCRQVGVEKELSFVVVVLPGFESLQLSRILLPLALHSIKLHVTENSCLVILLRILSS